MKYDTYFWTHITIFCFKLLKEALNAKQVQKNNKNNLKRRKNEFSSTVLVLVLVSTIHTM